MFLASSISARFKSHTATSEIQRLKCNFTCFPRIIFSYFFKPQRLKNNVWNATLLVFGASFSRIFSKNKSSFTKKKPQRLKIQRYYLFPWNVYIIVTKPFDFIDNAAYRFHYTCINENSCTISFIWLLGYLVKIPPWERGRDRKHPVAMSVMRNGTFCTTTIVRKKHGGNPDMRRTYFRDWRHFRSCIRHGPIPPGDPTEMWLELCWYATLALLCQDWKVARRNGTYIYNSNKQNSTKTNINHKQYEKRKLKKRKTRPDS